MRISSHALALATILGTTTVAATTKYKLASSIVTTAISGASAAKKAARGDGGTFQAIHRIEMWEQADDPCQLKVTSRHLNTFSSRSAKWSGCNGSPGSSKVLDFTNQETYVSGVQICVQNRNAIGADGTEKVKGLKVWGQKLNRANGQLSDAGTKKWERSTCHTWKAAVQCGAGKVASKVEIHFKDLKNDKATGLALQCRSVVPK